MIPFSTQQLGKAKPLRARPQEVKRRKAKAAKLFAAFFLTSSLLVASPAPSKTVEPVRAVRVKERLKVGKKQPFEKLTCCHTAQSEVEKEPLDKSSHPPTLKDKVWKVVIRLLLFGGAIATFFTTLGLLVMSL